MGAIFRDLSCILFTLMKGNSRSIRELRDNKVAIRDKGSLKDNKGIFFFFRSFFFIIRYKIMILHFFENNKKKKTYALLKRE